MSREAQVALDGDASRPANMPAQIAQFIRDMITRGALSPGVHLGQNELATRFGMSRVPVREALKLLAAEGLVHHDQNRGFSVATLSSSEARQLYRIRQLVEAEVLSTVQWPSAGEVQRMHEEVDIIEALQKDGALADWAVHHRRFRESVFALSSEKFIVQEALRLWSVADRYRSLLAATPHPSVVPRGSTDRHLVDALAKRDRARLLAVFERDRGKIIEMLVTILQARGL